MLYGLLAVADPVNCSITVGVTGAQSAGLDLMMMLEMWHVDN